MDELDKSMPDGFWQKAFDEAAETPPPRVWDAIERRLDESTTTKILPLWGAGLASSRPIAWGMGIAASVAVFLVGWWVMRTEPASHSSLSHAHQSEPTKNVAVLKPGITKDASAKKLQEPSSPAIASATNPVSLPMSSVSSSDRRLATSSLERETDGPREQLTLALARKTNEFPSSVMVKAVDQSSSPRAASDIPLPLANHITAASFIRPRPAASDALSTKSAEFVAFEPLSGRALHLREFSQIHRIVWFRPAEPAAKPEVAKLKHKDREVWASASIMPGAFNPMVFVKAASIASNSSTLDALKSSANQQSVSSRASFSIAYQAGAGVQLTEHWSVESGIGYLAGRSTVETPAQLQATSFQGIASQNATSSNLYLDALRNSIHRSDLASALPQANFANTLYPSGQTNYNNQTRQVLTNDYQYMQMPLQVGYQLRPRKRLSLALLGGMITNIFIRNTVDNDVVVTSKDGVYRPISFAAIMGARFRYRPSRQWSASLAGIYQPSLGLGTQPDSQVQSQPTTTGMSFGVDYHF